MIAAGTHLSAYEVVAQIGAGGMGEVYKAHDTKLGRDVAIKILPEAFAHDSDRLARFQREAKMLASLNHPNIATIHGLELSNGTSYLVMELVQGETLAERIKREGPLPIEEALKIAVQIAEALEGAHEKGIMSPEQARGKAVDKRTDIWAFGCVLYELVTGKQAFEGKDITEILAAVVKTEPNWQVLPAATPEKIRDLLRHSLQKDKTLRLRDAGDARIEIQEALTAPPTAVGATAAAATKTWRERLTQVAAATMMLTAITFAIGFVLRAPKPPQPMPPLRLSAEIGANKPRFWLVLNQGKCIWTISSMTIPA